MMVICGYTFWGQITFCVPIADYDDHEAQCVWMVPGTFDHNGDAVQ